MKRLLFILLLSVFSFGQELDFQQLCINCAQAQGFFCGDDPSNWTQYSPNGCVQNSWINDGWEDCVDAADENAEGPTLAVECLPPPPIDCDTVFVDMIEYIYEVDTLEIPFYIYETIIQLDTIVETEYITQIVIDTVEVDVFVPEFIYVVDTVYAEVLDTMFIDVIDTVEVVTFDTIVEIEYVEFFTIDTVIEYVDIILTEYIDCDTGLPCSSNLQEIIKATEGNNRMYNLLGQAIREPKGLYIQNGKIKYQLKK